MKQKIKLLKTKILLLLSKIMIVLEAPLTLNGYTDMSKLVEIRTITYEGTFFFTLCMLKSFYRAAQISTPCYIHIDNRVSKWRKLLLQYHLPFAVLIDYPNTLVTQRVNSIKKFEQSFQGQKLLVGPNKSKAPKLLLIDSDILFFRTPSDLLEWIKNGKKSIFMEDTGSYVMLSKGEFRDYLGVNRVKKNINTGIVGLIKNQPLVNKRNLLHLLTTTAQIINERRIPDHESLFWKNNYILIEQTAYIYFLSKLTQNKSKSVYTLLPPMQYQLVARLDFTKNPIAVHYAGESKNDMYDHYRHQMMIVIKKLFRHHQ